MNEFGSVDGYNGKFVVCVTHCFALKRLSNLKGNNTTFNMVKYCSITSLYLSKDRFVDNEFDAKKNGYDEDYSNVNYMIEFDVYNKHLLE